MLALKAAAAFGAGHGSRQEDDVLWLVACRCELVTAEAASGIGERHTSNSSLPLSAI